MSDGCSELTHGCDPGDVGDFVAQESPFVPRLFLRRLVDQEALERGGLAVLAHHTDQVLDPDSAPVGGDHPVLESIFIQAPG